MNKKTSMNKEVDEWIDGMGYAMRRPDNTLFNQMLSGVRQQLASFENLGKEPTDILFMSLILEQQKMITWLLEGLKERLPS